MEIFQDGELEEEMRKSDFQVHSLSAIWQLFSSSYQEAIKSLTCPMRASYSVPELGPTHFTIESPESDSLAPTHVLREDFQLLNPRGEALECSFWCVQTSTPEKTAPPATARPCIVYLHGMSSSRKECVYLRDRVLALGFSLFTLDFSGSGLSEGDRMSFGHFERDDLRTVLDFLFATKRASRVGLWGRCIGGAAALLCLTDYLDYNYRRLRVSKRDALKLQVGQCKQTGNLLCVRPGRVFSFRVTQVSVTNGDFVILSVNGRTVKGLDVDACKRLISDSSGDSVEISGYEYSAGSTTPSAFAGMMDEKTKQQSFVYALALDSTFGDMERVISDMLTEVSKSAEKRNVSFPATMMAAASKIISRSVRKSAGYQFKDIAVLDTVHRLTVPCQFISASKVDFIRPEHTRAVFDEYGGPKHWLPFIGEHDRNRPDHVVDTVCQHFLKNL